MGDFIRVSHRAHCGCIYTEYEELLTPCAGHRDREVRQLAKRAPVIPIKRARPVHFFQRFFNALNPFHKGDTRQ